MENKGVFVGRANPIHLGHEVIINNMANQLGFKNCLMTIGSCNHPFSLRHFFSYEERRSFIKTLFPTLPIVGLPDYPTDTEWLVALDDILSASGFNPQETIFFGGCEEDILFFLDAERKCQILNRFDGSSPKISATEVRDGLIYGRPLEGLLNPLIADEVKNLFSQKWERFKKI